MRIWGWTWEADLCFRIKCGRVVLWASLPCSKSLQQRPHLDPVLVHYTCMCAYMLAYVHVHVYMHMVCISPISWNQAICSLLSVPSFLFNCISFYFFKNFAQFQLYIFITSLSKCLALRRLWFGMALSATTELSSIAECVCMIKKGIMLAVNYFLWPDAVIGGFELGSSYSCHLGRDGDVPEWGAGSHAAGPRGWSLG